MEREVRKKVGIRILWKIVWVLLVRPFPRSIASRWEIFLLRLFGAHIGRNCVVYSSAVIWLPEHLIMEEGSLIADHVRIQNSQPLFLKKGAVVSQYSYICDGNHYVVDTQIAYAKSITLEENCWIGAECYVGCGVTVGRGCMVGARSVVMKSVPPYAIISGNPCKVIGFRFTPEEIVEMEKNGFDENQRLPIAQLEHNYNKYFLLRIKEIKEWSKL